MYDWDFNFIVAYIPSLLNGLKITLFISALSIIFGTILGVFLGIARKSKIFILSICSTIFIEIFLALPVLVLLIWVYYCLPLFIGINLNETTTAVLSFTLSLAAFIAETVRSGINSIPQGQIEAGLTLQLSKIQVYRFIILPQAIRLMLPALLTQYLTTIKLTTLASVIAVYELLHTSNNIVSLTYRPLEVYTVVAIIFLIVIIPINLFVRRIEK